MSCMLSHYSLLQIRVSSFRAENLAVLDISVKYKGSNPPQDSSVRAAMMAAIDQHCDPLLDMSNNGLATLPQSP